MHLGHGWFVTGFILLAGLAAFTLLAPPRATGQTLYDPMMQIETYAGGFTSPGFFEFLPSPPSSPVMFLVGEIGKGRVLRYRNGILNGVALDLAIATAFERGLFGIALHPQFATQPWVYIYYTASRTGADTTDPNGALENRVSRFTWADSLLVGEQVLLHLPVGFNHNGGALAFGPDGMLYGSIGEAGSTEGQMQNVATGPPPNDTSMIFRIRDDGTFPPDNPFFALGGAMQKVYVYGIRNVFSLAFDPQSGDLWCTDNGAASYDEIDRVVAGMNGGWKRIVGPVARDAEGTNDLWSAAGSVYVDPGFSFFQSFGITALRFQRGTALGENYAGDLFVAAHNSTAMYRFDVASDRTSLVMPDSSLDDLVAETDAERDLVLWASNVGVITDMETGPDGALYALRFSTPPQLYRISRRRTSAVGETRATARLEFTPNPFRRRTRLRTLDAPLERAARLHVYSPAGALVRVLMPRGAELEWDGRDTDGRRLPAGVYLARLFDGRGGPPVHAKLVRVE